MRTSLGQLAGDAGLGIHLLFRLSPVPTSAISYSMGAIGARWQPFLAAAGVGVIPQWLWVHSGSLARDSYHTDRPVAAQISLAVSVLAAILLGIVISRLVSRSLKELSIVREDAGGHGTQSETD